MQTRRNAQTLERFFLLEARADLAQDGHLVLSPVHAAASAFSLIQILDIVIAHEILLYLSSFVLSGAVRNSDGVDEGQVDL
jgi:hypothetical protein